MIGAAVDGIENREALPPSTDRDVLFMTAEEQRAFTLLPDSIDKARACAHDSAFIGANLPDSVVKAYCNK